MTRNSRNNVPAETEKVLFDGGYSYDASIPVLSVVIPVYQVDKYLPRCLESVTEQTFQNLEIIVVEDCSGQKDRAIIESFCRRDPRIRYIRHSRNMGLFQARITGMKYASGEYFAFLDGDDSLSVDYYRLLMDRIRESSADMVIGDFADEYEDGRLEYYNFDNLRFRDIDLSGEKVYETFLGQHGLWFGWHTVWNKVCRRSLWDASRDVLEQFSRSHGRLVMTEDIAFSCVFWRYARRVVNCHGALYRYFHHAGQSVANSDLAKFSGSLNDVAAVFGFFRDFLIREGLFEKYQKDYEAFREVYIQFWTGNADALQEEADRRAGRRLIQKLFGHVWERNGKDHFHYSMRSSIASFEFYEDIKKNICSEQTQTVSFDVFDTLLVRPFLKPSDLFALMDDAFNEMVSARSYVDFQKIRMRTEEALRKELNMGVEEVRLGDIYEKIGSLFGLTREQTNELKDLELGLEERFIRARRTGKELYELAKSQKKRIICISDMYLSGAQVERLLRRCGYEADRVYVSGDYRMTKQSGKLYGVMLRMERTAPDRIVHIGDNWNSDVVMAKNAGLRSYHLASPVSMLKGENPGIYTGCSYRKIFGVSGKIYMGESAAEYLGIRCMLALVANRIFDNPYTAQFHPETDFNCDPYYIGYYLLGMHVYAVADWVLRTAREEHRQKVHFVSRDGFLPWKAFRILAESRGAHTDSGYLYISRKATAILQSGSAADVESYLNSFSSDSVSIRTPIDTFAVIAKEQYQNSLERLSESGLIYFGKTGGFPETMKLGKLLFEEYLDAQKAEAYIQQAKEHFQKLLRKGDLLFDLGYRANKEYILSSLIGRPVDCLYLYTNESRALERARRMGFSIRTFYDYTPTAYAAARELMFSETGPSCVGYDMQNGMAPLFDPDYQEHYFNEFVLNTMQEAALDFVRDFERTFRDTPVPFLYRGFDASLPFEFFLHYSAPADRQIFGCITFEDDSFAGKPSALTEEWQKAISYHRLDQDVPEKEVVRTVIRSNDADQEVLRGLKALPDGLEELYVDGLFVKAFRALNEKLPPGSRRRETIKKAASLLISQDKEKE